MKESKFIELLNLYVDREITSEDAALLEAEIARSPERRKVYQQYCRMQRASVLVFESFRSGQVPEEGTLAEASRNADDKIARFPAAGGPRFRWAYAGGLVAAAAAVVFIGRRALQAPAAIPALASQANKPVAVAQTAPVSTSLQKVSYRPVFVTKPFDGTSIQPGGLFASQQAQSLDWMKQIQLPPLRSIPTGEFTLAPKGDTKQELRLVPVSKQAQGRVEMMAFQFQR